MAIGLLTVYISFPDCHSLKEKRSLIKPVLARLQREFNIAAAEMDHLDSHAEATIQCAALSTSNREVQAYLQHVLDFIPEHWPNIEILKYRIESF